MSIRHPAKYTDSFISIFADLLKDRNNVLDPFAGTGKLGLIKQCGFSGTIYANEIEPEWINENLYDCDLITCQDAEFLDYPPRILRCNLHKPDLRQSYGRPPRSKRRHEA